MHAAGVALMGAPGDLLGAAAGAASPTAALAFPSSVPRAALHAAARAWGAAASEPRGASHAAVSALCTMASAHAASASLVGTVPARPSARAVSALASASPAAAAGCLAYYCIFENITASYSSMNITYFLIKRYASHAYSRERKTSTNITHYMEYGT
jgi:hypothetical protein